MAANSRIWRDNNNPASAAVGEKVEFNEGSVPDNTAGITQSNITLTSAIALNPKPKQALDELQDTGLATITLIITGHISDPTNSAVPAIIKKWLIEDKSVVTTFPYGRFGIQLDDFPHYNLRPNANRGCMLTDWNWVRDGEIRGKASFVATVRIAANNTGLNAAGSYNWNTT